MTLRCVHRHTIEEHPACFEKGLIKYDFKDDREFERLTGLPWYQYPNYRIGYMDIETDNFNADWGTVLSWCIKLKGGGVVSSVITKKEILERIKTQPPEKKYKSGITALDNILDGFRENQLIVLAAPTKSGKSQMTIELAIRMPETNPVFIPFEESAEELVRKFHDVKETPPLFYTPKQITGNTVNWIEKKVVEGIVKFNSKIFFIDHLQ